eukprot:3349128-Ditylum_brightwellii.AAC.1
MIGLCMDIVQFGMKSTLIQLRSKYFVYNGAAKDKNLSNEDVALAIRAYKSAFLANIVAPYVFEETEECFRECIFRGIYRDDGQQLRAIHHQIWQSPPANKDNSPAKKDKKEKGVTVIYEQEFPFLDMKMGWDKKSREMRFSVFWKPNQALKYVNRASMHKPTNFKFLQVEFLYS